MKASRTKTSKAGSRKAATNRGTPSRAKVDPFQELEARYENLPSGLRERLIKSELTGSVLQLRLSDISARNTYANAVSGTLYESIQTKLVEVYGQDYGPLEYLTVLMRNTELPLSVRTKVSIELLPYLNAKLASKDSGSDGARNKGVSGVLVVPGVFDREAWEKAVKDFSTQSLEEGVQ